MLSSDSTHSPDCWLPTRLMEMYLKVELGAAWRANDPVHMSIGPVLHPDDAVTNKMGALYGRAQARDFIDIDAAIRSGRYSLLASRTISAVAGPPPATLRARAGSRQMFACAAPRGQGGSGAQGGCSAFELHLRYVSYLNEGEEDAVATSTSFRISDTAKARLASRAAREGMSATALLDQLIVEGVDQLDYPGIVFRGPAHDRRAALAAGPDVWEVISRLQELDGSEEQRISQLSAESDLHPRLIRVALDYAAEHPEGVRERINRNRAMAEHSRSTSRQREALLA